MCYMISKSLTDRLIIVPPMTIRIGQGSPGSLMVILSTTIHALTMGRIIVPVCVSWSTTLKRIRKGSGSTLHHTRSTRISFSRIRPDWRVALPYRCIETRLVMRWLMRLRISLRALPSLVRREYSSPMIRIVLAVTPPSVLKMKDGQDGRKYGGQSTIAYLSAKICKCDDADRNALYRKCCLSVGIVALAGNSLTSSTYWSTMSLAN
jgi:hypothetical protein